ncbi:BlaI/MecI/CopY family transcriptional regulator [Anaerorhabdus furcosa]|uniref:Predicted transcriptional regulator n=1 Tax=Anaerorhabdus furcosa TaxID=118967 RepID=A0A1T4QBS4_9FIRM|nr:BlaI/MecI/CopY family transcriptional regulator [Anaerorhabdus furcosa]SKA01240.1 Predicted transcriptional regulator [Anaerorhabdus furcosa]
MVDKVFDSERNILELLWEKDNQSAKEIAEQCEKNVGWSKTTTYTVIKKCVSKGLIQRIDPGFICHACIGKEIVCAQETDDLIQRNYSGNPDLLVASLLEQKKVSFEEIQKLKELIKKYE